MIRHAAFNISYKDGRTSCVEVVKNKYGKYFVQGDASSLSIAMTLPKFNDLLI